MELFDINLYRLVAELNTGDISYTSMKMKIYIEDLIYWNVYTKENIYKKLVDKLSQMYNKSIISKCIYNQMIVVIDKIMDDIEYIPYDVKFNRMIHKRKFRYEIIIDFIGIISNYIYFKNKYGQFIDYNIIRCMYSYIEYICKLMPNKYKYKRKFINYTWKVCEFDKRQDLYESYNKYLFINNDNNYHYMPFDILDNDDYRGVVERIFNKIDKLKLVLLYGSMKEIYDFIENI